MTDSSGATESRQAKGEPVRKGDTQTIDTKATCISQVATIFVPVSDQTRALEFYINKLGFEKRVDFAYGDGHRWIEVAPPGSTNAIALVPATEGNAVSSDQTHCALSTRTLSLTTRLFVPGALT